MDTCTVKRLIVLAILYPSALLAQAGPFEEDGIFVFGPTLAFTAAREASPGFDAGLAGEYVLGGRLTVSSGLAYSRRNFAPGDAGFTATSVKVPLALNLYTGWGTDCVEIFGLTLNAGLQLNLANRLEAELGAADSKADVQPTSFDGIFGVGYRTSRLHFSVQRTIGTSSDPFGVDGADNQYWSVGVSYFVNKLRKAR
jgi:hypothetical protein